MEVTKLKVLGFLNNTFMKRWVALAYQRELMAEIERVYERFNSATARFIDTVHDLYDCLKGADIALHEDFRWFAYLSISTHTKTAAEAHELVRKVVDGYVFLKAEDHLKQSDHSQPSPLLNWYSHATDVQGFITLMMVVLENYCYHMPRDPEVGPEFVLGDQIRWRNGAAEFCKSPHFKMMIDDLVVSVRLALVSNIRRLDVKAQKDPRS